MVKKVACVSCGSLKRFPHTFTTDNHIQEIPTFRDFTIRDPRYFVILFWASFHDFEEKKSKTKKKISEEVEPPKIKAKNIFKFFLLPI